MKSKNTLIEELIFLIDKGNAHASFEDAVAGIPKNLRTVIPDKLPYSIWQLVEHIRITQWDILEFCISEKHQSPKWPEEYWPAAVDEVSDKQWEHALAQIQKDRKRFTELLKEEKRDLFEPFPYGDGQNLLREALLIADHTSYHTGEILVIRRLLDCWK